MELAIWILVGLVFLIGGTISNQLYNIKGELNAIRVLLNNGNPDHRLIDYIQISTSSLSAINNLLQKKNDN